MLEKGGGLRWRQSPDTLDNIHRLKTFDVSLAGVCIDTTASGQDSSEMPDAANLEGDGDGDGDGDGSP